MSRRAGDIYRALYRSVHEMEALPLATVHEPR